MAVLSSTFISPHRMVMATANPNPSCMPRPSAMATLSRFVAPPVLSTTRPLGGAPLRSLSPSSSPNSSRGQKRVVSDGMQASSHRPHRTPELVVPLGSSPQQNGDSIHAPMSRLRMANSIPKCQRNLEAGSVIRSPSMNEASRSSSTNSCPANAFLESNSIAVWASSFLWAPYLMPLHSLALTNEGGVTPGSLFDLSDLDPASASILSNIFGPLFSILTFLFIIRIVMTWYPQLPANKFPFYIAYIPTEIVLRPTRQLIPPVGGVDVTPVIWVALISFLNEILLGQQGLLVLLAQKQV